MVMIMITMALVMIIMALVMVLVRSPSTAGWDTGAVLVVGYLGLVPTALGFYLWNKGAAQVGAGVLGAANNLKIPLAVLIAWIVFGEQGPYLRALGGMGLITLGLLLATRFGAGRRS